MTLTTTNKRLIRAESCLKSERAVTTLNAVAAGHADSVVYKRQIKRTATNLLRLQGSPYEKASSTTEQQLKGFQLTLRTAVIADCDGRKLLNA